MGGFRDLSTIPPQVEEQGPAPEEIQAQIGALEDRLVPFDTPAWYEVENIVKAELGNQSALFDGLGAMSSEQLREIRGRTQALRWLLRLPEAIREDIRKLQVELDDLSGTSEQGEADGNW